MFFFCLSYCVASFNAAQMQLYPKDEDLVLLWLPENTGAYANDEPGFPEMSVHFGYVSKSSISSNGGGVLLCVGFNCFFCLFLFFFMKFRIGFPYFTLLVVMLELLLYVLVSCKCTAFTELIQHFNY